MFPYYLYIFKNDKLELIGHRKGPERMLRIRRFTKYIDETSELAKPIEFFRGKDNGFIMEMRVILHQVDRR